MKKMGNFLSGFFTRKNQDSKQNDQRNKDGQTVSHPQKQDDKAITIKCLVLGGENTGKTSLITRFVTGKYDEKKEINSNDYDNDVVTSQHINGYDVKFCIKDPSKRREFRDLTSSYFRGLNVAIICYDDEEKKDITKIYDDIKLNIAHIDRFVHLAQTIIYVVRTKDDNSSYYSEPDEFLDLQDRDNPNLRYISISSKNDINVKELFNNIVEYHLQILHLQNMTCYER